MGTQELIIIFLIVLVLFGASRLPALGASLGSAIRNFKKGFSGDEEAAPKAEEKKLATGAPSLGTDEQARQKQS